MFGNSDLGERRLSNRKRHDSPGSVFSRVGLASPTHAGKMAVGAMSGRPSALEAVTSHYRAVVMKVATTWRSTSVGCADSVPYDAPGSQNSTIQSYRGPPRVSPQQSGCQVCGPFPGRRPLQELWAAARPAPLGHSSRAWERLTLLVWICSLDTIFPAW